MKTNKKLLSSIVLLSLVVLSGCNGNKDLTDQSSGTNGEASNGSSITVAKEGFPIVEEPLTLTLMAPGVGMAEWNEMPTLQEYSEKTNINFEYETPPQSDFATRLNLTFASGELPDIIYAGGPNSLNASLEVDYGGQGLLLPLEDMLEDYAPNFYALMEENPEIRQSITTTDGHIYALPNIVKNDTASWIMGPVWYNGSWMDALGVKEVPKTVDEFYDLLVRFRDEDPNGNNEKDEIPLSDVSLNGVRGWIMPAFGIKGWGIEEHDGKARYTFATENFRGYLEFMNKLYSEKLIDQELFSQSNEQLQAKGQNNQLGVFPGWFSYFTTGRTPDEAINDPMYGPLTSEFQEEPLMPMDPGIKRGSFAITKENPSPEASLRWIDYFYSPEGYAYLLQGPEGYLWEWENEEGGKKVYNEEIQSSKREEYRGSITPAYGITVPGLSVETEPIGGETSDFDKFLKKETEEKINPYGEVIYPLVYLTKEEQEEVSQISVDLTTFIVEHEAQFITNAKELNDESWNDYLQTLKKIGVERFEEIHQDAYDRWEKAGE